ncbi:class I SAM-dependent methyltransferase [Deinococcus deserti]|uniref:Putative S-adenosylmethionine-dependent methyltransferase n=1 Tax=Deinococcus deserti (strain DSM 17065 / CIP 109153 / LMG 22923 / VCD115) TaxID=546414 RepID=C1CW55_DEIDV|nr:class I SAM-dependent methyltransferase [Deinococcus deserti]ACO46422.2 putative S-adenosylmethionine-dependent methyltransferase [Deinococcus deserti VCD115]
MLIPAVPDLVSLLARRAHLSAQGTTIYRGIHTTETDGVFALDVAGDAGILSLYQDLSPQEETQLASSCGEATGLAGIYLKRRPVEARHAANVAREWLSPPEPVWGESRPEVTGLEGGVPFVIRPGGDLSTGLFTDARPAREYVRATAPARVLNTFAYTCGFGLNAALGGAETIKNVDLSRRVLSWGQENYALSGLNAPDTDFLYGDVFEWLSRLHRRGDHFDLVVLDPPSFARSKAGIWRAEKDYARLVALAAAVVAPGGRVLALLNHAGVSPDAFGRMIHSGLSQTGRSGGVSARFTAGEDYPGACHLKVQVWTLDQSGV